MRVFLDANVLFSAAKSDGAVRELLRRLVAAGHELVADAFVVEESRRNLTAKGAAALDDFQRLLDGPVRRLAQVSAVTGATDMPDLSWLATKDHPVVLGALRAKADVLVTGDRAHFGSAYGRRIGSLTVHSPRSLFEAAFSPIP